MKKKSFTLLVVAAVCSSMMFTSCIGSFGLSNKLLSWNKSLGSKFANEVVFFVLWVFPVYEVSLFLDVILFNSIEFWSGSNPIADTGIKTIETKDGVYTVETKADGYHIEKQGEGKTLDFKFDEQNQTWSMSSDGVETKIMQYKDAEDVVMFLPDGKTMDVELSAAGMTAFRNAMMEYTYFAAR